MILLLGAGGYVGQAFATALRCRKNGFVPLAQNAFDYSRFELLFDYVRKLQPELVINATGGLDEMDPALGRSPRTELSQAQSRLALTITRVGAMTRTPLAHVSTGNLYLGAKILEPDGVRLEPNLAQPAVRDLFQTQPERFMGFAECDEPNGFAAPVSRTLPHTSRAAMEEKTRDPAPVYVWRMRLPFNQEDDPGNYLSRMLEHPVMSDGINSFSHLDDAVQACMELWERRAAFGTYNVVNPGPVTTIEIIRMIQRILKPSRWGAWARGELVDSSFEEPADCILDSSKLSRAGIRMRPAKQAFESAIEKWQPRSLRIA